MEIINIEKKEQLNEFIGSVSRSRFPQSWEWGEFQQGNGNKIFRLGLVEGNSLIAAATLIKKELGLGRSYFYCSAGPVMKNFQFHPARGYRPISPPEADQPRADNFQLNPKSQNPNTKQALNELFEGIYDIAKKEKVIFLRYEPAFEIKNLKFKINKTIDIQPSKTLVLDLTKTEDELLKGMHPKTRYNIRLAEKKGVMVREGTGDDFEKFWRIMCDTKERDGFRVHGKDYYFKMLSLNNKESASNEDPNFQFPISPPEADPPRAEKVSIKLYVAEYEGKIIASNVIAFFGDTVTYVHGASSNEFRNVMAPLVLQWQGIMLAKLLGYKYYDFYGIDENKWPGVTRFKKGFGGNEIQYPGTFDLVFDNQLYNFYKMIRHVRRLF